MVDTLLRRGSIALVERLWPIFGAYCNALGDDIVAGAYDYLLEFASHVLSLE
jgi:hypothetical protein